MAKPEIKFVPSIAGFRQVRNSGPVQRVCLRAAQGIAQRARHGRYSYQTDVQPGKTRCHARVAWSPSEYMALEGHRAYYESMSKDPAKGALERASKEYRL